MNCKYLVYLADYFLNLMGNFLFDSRTFGCGCFFEFGIAKCDKIWYTDSAELRNQADGAGITDTFAYDTYGKMTSRTGTTPIIFGYNGLYGVVTDANGLLYMRARYYSPAMRRFVNADIIPGNISKAVTLNRYAFADANPVLKVDPLGLSSESSQDLADYPHDVLVLVYSGEIHWPPANEDEWEMVNAAVKRSEMRTQPPEQTIVAAPDYVKEEQYKKDYANSHPKVEKDNKQVSSWYEDVNDWFIETGEWFNKYWLNKDGSYSLYDNRRIHPDALFHEQLLVVTPSGPSFNLKNGNIGLGSLSIDAITGGWEGDHTNLSLLDFFHADASAQLKDGQLSIGALASIWSPSFSFDLWGLTIKIGVEVGAVGAGIDVGSKSFNIKGAYLAGFSISLSW